MAEDEFEPTVAASVEPIKILDEELSVEEVVDDIHNRFSQMTFDQLITKLREAEEMIPVYEDDTVDRDQGACDFGTHNQDLMGDSLGAESERFQPTRGHRRMISVASDKGVVEEKALQSALCARCGILQYYAEGYKQPACLHCAVRTLTAFFASSSAMQSVSSLGNTSPPVLLQTSPSPSSCSGAPSPRNGAQSFRNGAPPSRNGDPPSYAGASSSIRSQVQGGDQAAEVDGDSTTVPKARKSQANVYPPGTREITVVDWLCRKTAELKKEKKKARGSSMEAQK